MFAAKDNVLLDNWLYISCPILSSMAAAINAVNISERFTFLNAVLILFRAEFPVFQCSSAPAGSIPPL